MTKLNCPKCGPWDYTGDNKKGQKATCPKCTRRVTIPIMVLCLLALFTVGYSYAEQQATVVLPLETPFAEHNCISYGVEPLNETSPAKTSFVCYWDWYIDPRITEEINHIINSPEATPEEKARAIEALVTANPFVPKDKNGTNIGVGIGDEVGGTTPVTPEESVVTEKLAQCLRGFDRSHEWGAFVDTQVIPSWLNNTREQFSERDNLSSRLVGNTHIYLLPSLKAIEECIAIQRYVDLGMIGDYEAILAVHDRFNIGKNNQPVPLPRGSEGKSPLNTPDALNQKLKDEAIRAREFACSPANEARKLCSGTFGFYGINRGISQPIVSKDAFVNAPLSPNDGKTAVDVYSAYLTAKAGSVLTEKDKLKYRMEMNQVVCDQYFVKYKHKLGTDHFPEWLHTACMAGTKSTQFVMKERQSLE